MKPRTHTWWSSWGHGCDLGCDQLLSPLRFPARRWPLSTQIRKTSCASGTKWRLLAGLSAHRARDVSGEFITSLGSRARNLLMGRSFLSENSEVIREVWGVSQKDKEPTGLDCPLPSEGFGGQLRVEQEETSLTCRLAAALDRRGRASSSCKISSSFADAPLYFRFVTPFWKTLQ